jgi:hypothetical protein
MLHPKLKIKNEFAKFIHNSQYRFDIEKSSSEVERLLYHKIEYVKIGIKYSIQYLNEDISQIPSESHQKEQLSFAITRDACAKIGVMVKKYIEDNYSPIDFRINDIVKIQDKCGKMINMRRIGRLPYNPDTFDVLQISNLETQIVYAIPMRVIKNDKVESMFSEYILMRNTITIIKSWENTYKKFKYDLKTDEGIHAYVEACEDAATISELTDRKFYKNMIDNNKEKFGSKKQIKEKQKLIIK